MTNQAAKKLRQLNDFLWTNYERNLPPSGTARLAVILRTRTEDDAALACQVLKRMRCKQVDISKRGWWLARRWAVVAETEPLELARPVIDEWSQSILHSLEGTSAELAHWVPLWESPDAGA
jgi:hypothetical protein